MTAPSSAPLQTPSQSRARVAILIDGDHIPATLRPAILQQAQELGQVISLQVFCDLSLRADWANQSGLDAHHCKGCPGKNTTDITLCISALDLAYRGLATTFLIVSDDRDFEPLLRHLHRLGFEARRMGQPPVSRRDSQPPTISPPAKAKTSAPAETSDLTVTLVRHAIATKGSARGLPLVSLNHALSATGFRISATPQKTWHAWLRAHPEHFICDPKGPDACVRLAL